MIGGFNGLKGLIRRRKGKGTSRLNPAIDYLHQMAGVATSSPYTFSEANIGDISPKREVVVAIYGRRNSNGLISAVTIGGQPATLHQITGSYMHITIARAAAVEGSAADVVVSWTGTFSSIRAAFYRVITNNPGHVEAFTQYGSTLAISLEAAKAALAAVVNNDDDNGQSLSGTTNLTIDMSRLDTGGNRISEVGRVNDPAASFGVSAPVNCHFLGIGWS
ncbi:hypothetical protein [Shinella sp.]|jgi:hypothetical protein|uniref:hypothetical protein n=1 Tax=Shinella sp. TaxID=1870904 RepID=UPI003F6EBF39